jgi:hypothetical protein
MNIPTNLNKKLNVMSVYLNTQVVPHCKQIVAFYAVQGNRNDWVGDWIVWLW